MDCFISYSHTDSEVALSVEGVLAGLGLRAFLAEVSLDPGDRWTDEIWGNLRKAKSVIFLASMAACASPYVQQELGGAIYGSKRIVPVVWDMPLSELPGWANQSHAVDLRGRDPAEYVELLTSKLTCLQCEKVDQKQVIIAVVGLVLLAALACYASKEDLANS